MFGLLWNAALPATQKNKTDQNFFVDYGTPQLAGVECVCVCVCVSERARACVRACLCVSINV